MTAINNPSAKPAKPGKPGEPGRAARETPVARLLSPSAASPGRRSANGPLPLSVDVERDGSTVVLRLCGELDMATADELRLCIRAVLTEHDPHRLLLDLAELTFTDSTGLAVLVWAHKQLANRKRQLRLYHPHRQLSRILYITGLDTRLHITEER